MIGKKFYGRVRQLVPSKTAYYPVFLSQYELIAHGFWRGFSYGMVVFHREDYLKLPGFNMTKVGWGEEDVELYQQFLNQKSLTVIRKAIQISKLRSNLFHDQFCSFLKSYYVDRVIPTCSIHSTRKNAQISSQSSFPTVSRPSSATRLPSKHCTATTTIEVKHGKFSRYLYSTR